MLQLYHTHTCQGTHMWVQAGVQQDPINILTQSIRLGKLKALIIVMAYVKRLACVHFLNIKQIRIQTVSIVGYISGVT